MNETLKDIKKLCSSLSESKVEIKGNKYNVNDVIELAQKYDGTVVSIQDAVRVVKQLKLFTELERMFKNKDVTRFI